MAHDLRQAAVAKFGPLTTGNPGWYAKASAALFRHGLEKPARKVVEEFLGKLETLRELRSRHLTPDTSHLTPRTQLTYAHRLSRPKHALKTSLRSETHATDSTCRAKNSVSPKATRSP